MKEFSGNSVFYPKLNISEHQLATAIAFAVLEDFRVNANAIAGFPQILVKPILDEQHNPIRFDVDLSWQIRNIVVPFHIEVEQAQREVEFFYQNKYVSKKFMEFIQEKVSEFERLNSEFNPWNP